MTKHVLDNALLHIEPDRFPKHVAIIMDGNGRWARNRLLPREAGHVKGITSVRKVVRAASEIGLQYLTLYTFSTENWRRPLTEVRHLMGLFRRYCRADVEKLHRHNVRIRFIGSRTGLDGDILGLIEDAEKLTAANSGLKLTFAFNYGAREELAETARILAHEAAAGTLDPAAIDAAMFGARMQSAGCPDVDLMIRSGGERRISNFLLWQAAYAELVFTGKLWPEFGREDLVAAIAEFARRDWRFGGVKNSDAPAASDHGATRPSSWSLTKPTPRA